MKRTTIGILGLCGLVGFSGCVSSRTPLGDPGPSQTTITLKAEQDLEADRERELAAQRAAQKAEEDARKSEEKAKAEELARQKREAEEARLRQEQEVRRAAEQALAQKAQWRIAFQAALTEGLYEDAWQALLALQAAGEDVGALRQALEKALASDIARQQRLLETAIQARERDTAEGAYAALEALLEWGGRNGLPVPSVNLRMYENQLRFLRIYTWLQSISCVGPEDRDQSFRWWTIARAEALQNKDSLLAIDGLRVQLLGVARISQLRSPGIQDGYDLVDLPGDWVEIYTSGSGVPLPNEYIYMLGVVRVREDGSVFVEEVRRYRILQSSFEQQGEQTIPTMDELRRWLDFDFQYAMENTFRRCVCVNSRGIGLPVISRGEWEGDRQHAPRRTTVAEVENYLDAPLR